MAVTNVVTSKLVSIFCLIAFLGACTSKDKSPERRKSLTFRAITVEDVSPPEEALPCPILPSLFLGLLFCDVGWEGEVAPALEVEGLCAKDPKTGRFLVTVRALLNPSPPGEPKTFFEGIGLREATTLLGFLELLPKALCDALSLAVAQYRVSTASTGEILEILSRPQDHPKAILIAAIDAARERGLRGAVPGLIGLLSVSDYDVLVRTVGALGTLGDQRALRPLGRVALSQDRALATVALQAIADIGGDEASKVLEFVINQTTDPEMARRAIRILQEMRREK